MGVPEVLSCGGHFRQRRYEDRRDETSFGERGGWIGSPLRLTNVDGLRRVP